ncbi:hypothetical protein F2Q69_00058110 [Brassica cretica]|uniref:Uncharacterized protein n=2 Tax=Brassica cretica TaxID=69181 RepID=A0A8S9RP37_BRACR|nr:hypothetical protein DY000_02051769 [Brassica cretica]KAF3574415.1 hypothetical protein F2Q69_00058110 [Brassica cretica]
MISSSSVHLWPHRKLLLEQKRKLEALSSRHNLLGSKPLHRLQALSTVPTRRDSHSCYLRDRFFSLQRSLGLLRLSESSFFVYPYKVIIKTCDITKLLLLLPALLLFLVPREIRRGRFDSGV